jgi:hypothetical protein
MLDSVFWGGLTLLAVVLPVSIAASSLVFFPLLGLWVLAGPRGWRRFPGPWGLPEKIFAAYLLISVLSCLAGMRPLHSLGELKKDFYVTVMWLVAAFLRGRSWENPARLFTVAAVATAALGIVQYLSGIRISDPHHGHFMAMPASFSAWPEWCVRPLAMIRERAAGTRSHPLTFAEGLLLALPFALAWMATLRGRRGWLWALGSAVLLGGLVASQSRGPWLAATCIVLLAVICFPRRQALLHGLPLLLPVLALALSPGFRERLRTISDRTDATNTGRIHMWQVGWDLLRQHPFLGVGPGNVKPATLPYLTPGERIGGPWGHLHSNVVNIATERGGLGLAAFTAFFVALAWELIGRWRRAVSDSDRVILFTALGALLGFVISGFTETVYNDTEIVMMLFFVLGLARQPFNRSSTPPPA